MNETPETPAVYGWIALGIALLAAACLVVAGVDGGVQAIKKGLFLAIPLSLVALLPGLATRQTTAGKAAVLIATMTLLVAGIVVVVVLVAATRR